MVRRSRLGAADRSVDNGGLCRGAAASPTSTARIASGSTYSCPNRRVSADHTSSPAACPNRLSPSPNCGPYEGPKHANPSSKADPGPFGDAGNPGPNRCGAYYCPNPWTAGPVRNATGNGLRRDRLEGLVQAALHY